MLGASWGKRVIGARPGGARWRRLIAIVALLWLGRETVSPFLLGGLLGALCLLNWGVASLAAKPFVTLAKTARPLLLPLLVVVAIGAAPLSLAVQSAAQRGPADRRLAADPPPRAV